MPKARRYASLSSDSYSPLPLMTASRIDPWGLISAMTFTSAWAGRPSCALGQATAGVDDGMVAFGDGRIVNSRSTADGALPARGTALQAGSPSTVFEDASAPRCDRSV